MKEQPTTEIVTVPQDEKGTIEIVPFGTDERIRLSAAIVRQQIAVPTRTGKQPDDKQCIKFMMLCRARHLNPWEGDAYMLGYDTQSGPQFSLITAHQVFLKRAEASKGFNGMESGVIVERAIGADLSNIVEREGDLVYDGERLIAGGVKAYRGLGKGLPERSRETVLSQAEARHIQHESKPLGERSGWDDR